jgi:undecaprenol kinase
VGLSAGAYVKNRPFRVRLGCALWGIRQCWRTENSFRSHVLMGSLALIALAVLRPAPVWWALVGLAICLVLALELVNSAFERLIDHLHPEIHPEIRLVKDMAAGGVLVISAGAVVVAAALAASLF